MRFLNHASPGENASVLEEQKETFVATLGHDLKNPTIAQMRALELLIKGQFGELNSSQKQVLKLMLDSCGYMYSILGSFLTTYKYEQGTIKLKMEDFSLVDITRECIDEMVYFANSKDISIVFKNEDKDENTIGDKIQLKRVILNLLTNGIKYAESNTDLNINIYNEGRYNCFCFENKSPYIPKEKREKIFAKYVSFSGERVKLGVGLGLYSSKKIIEAHDGEMFVNSFPDNRNVFGFKIPSSENYIDKERFVTF